MAQKEFGNVGVEWAQPAHYLAIDPGKSTGWATFNENGAGARNGVVYSRVDVYGLLTKVQPKFLIVEDFALFPWKSNAQAWSKFEEVRVIGAIEFWAFVKQVPMELQPSSVLAIATKWAGLKIPKGHLPDEMSAYSHGVYYLQRHGLRSLQQGAG